MKYVVLKTQELDGGDEGVHGVLATSTMKLGQPNVTSADC